VVVAASIYHPVVFWGENAWDLSSPIKILLVGAAIAAVGLLVVWLLARFGIDRRSAALGVATGTLTLTQWDTTPAVPLLLLVALPFAVVWVADRLSRSRLLDVLTVVVVAVFGVAPLVELVLAHVEQAAPYPTKQLATRSPAEATGKVEDIVVVIVDSYPSLSLAEEWYGHDTSILRDGLSDKGFDVPRVAWSQLTFTDLSVPSLLELQPVIGEGPLEPWRNVSSVNGIMRGDSLVSTTLMSAGFSYTHIESGSDALACGNVVERCTQSPWIDEPVWELLRTTIAGGWMEERFGSYTVAGTLSAAHNLTRLGDDLIGNGSHDYVFAHLYLPHPPLVVDAECRALDGGPFSEPPIGGARSDTAYLNAFSDQLACVDDLLVTLAGIAAPSTAVLITADHGPGFGGQLVRDGSTWTDADVAERLGILLAYRLPDGCEPPVDTINVDVMRAIMSCSVDMELPVRRPDFLLGAENPVAVAPDRMARIRSDLEAGTIEP
jgi:hypothetical protein